VREDRCQTPIQKLKTISLRPPIDLMYCAGSCEAAGALVRFRDYAAEEVGWCEFLSDLDDFAPTEVLVSVTTLSLARDLHAADLIKARFPSARVIALGAHFNTLDVDALQRFPSLGIVLRGEYEHAAAEIASGKPLEVIPGITWRNQTGEIVKNLDRVFEENLDTFAFPARHLVLNDLYTRPDTGAVQTTIVTNRGCPFHCSYCLANQVAGTRNRYRSVENVMAELRLCVEQFGIRSFLFRSELFTQNKRWVVELCKAIIDSGLRISWACNSRVDTLSSEMLTWMKRAGCWVIAFGVESGDQATLDRVNKRSKVEDAFTAVSLARAANIRSSVYLLIGLPWDDTRSIERQAQFARELDPDFLEVFYPYPFPGTSLQQEAIELGLLGPDEIPDLAYSEPAMPTLHLSKADLMRQRQRVLRSFYLRPRVVARTIRAIRSYAEAKNYLQAGLEQLFARYDKASA